MKIKDAKNEFFFTKIVYYTCILFLALPMKDREYIFILVFVLIIWLRSLLVENQKDNLL